MFKGLICSYSIFGVNLQHFPEQIHGQRVYTLIKLLSQVEIHLAILNEELLGGFSLEERLSSQQNMKHHSHREYITRTIFNSLISCQQKHLWRHKPRSAALDKRMLFLQVHGQAEICDDELKPAVLSEHDIIGLDVSMHHAPVMQSSKPREELPHSLSHLFLPAALPNAALQQVLPAQLHHDVYGAIRIINLLNPQQMAMFELSNFPQDLDLFLKPNKKVFVLLKLRFPKSLDRESLPIHHSHHFIDGRTRSSAYPPHGLEILPKTKLIKIASQKCLPPVQRVELDRPQRHFSFAVSQLQQPKWIL